MKEEAMEEEGSAGPAPVLRISLNQPHSNLRHKMSVPVLCMNFRENMTRPSVTDPTPNKKAKLLPTTSSAGKRKPNLLAEKYFAFGGDTYPYHSNDQIEELHSWLKSKGWYELLCRESMIPYRHSTVVTFWKTLKSIDSTSFQVTINSKNFKITLKDVCDCLRIPDVTSSIPDDTNLANLHNTKELSKIYSEICREGFEYSRKQPMVSVMSLKTIELRIFHLYLHYSVLRVSHKTNLTTVIARTLYAFQTNKDGLSLALMVFLTLRDRHKEKGSGYPLPHFIQRLLVHKGVIPNYKPDDPNLVSPLDGGKIWTSALKHWCEEIGKKGVPQTLNFSDTNREVGSPPRTSLTSLGVSIPSCSTDPSQAPLALGAPHPDPNFNLPLPPKDLSPSQLLTCQYMLQLAEFQRDFMLSHVASIKKQNQEIQERVNSLEKQNGELFKYLKMGLEMDGDASPGTATDTNN